MSLDSKHGFNSEFSRYELGLAELVMQPQSSVGFCHNNDA